mmetsp:Transcript_16011/g.44273  ORF Transcript_16011/g.44273 Transcript_16011/m.44273 type:complete len:491 (+) Transcript_16011:338-1810(+)
MVAFGKKGRLKFPFKSSLQLIRISEDGTMSGDHGETSKDHPELMSSSTLCAEKPPLTGAARRRMFEVDGHPLEHWKKDNFEPKRDATCRVVYEPKEGKQFYQKALKSEEYDIMRGLNNTLEQPYFSKYNRFFPQRGHFCCKACGNPLYSHETKFDIDDGWPAFGACVLGAIGITPADERKSQIEKEDSACIKIQALVRGNQCRNRVATMLDELIEEMLRRKAGGAATVKATESDSDSEREEKFDGKLQGKSSGYVLSRALGENYSEIHCHRCKSHLGDVYVQVNSGNHGELFLEHHRVNGRAIKYMHANLPKRTDVYASLLFANESQKRRLGLPDTAQETIEEQAGFLFAPSRIRPRKSLEPFSESDHEYTSQSQNPNEFVRKPADAISVSSHAVLYSGGKHNGNNFGKSRRKKTPSGLSASVHAGGFLGRGRNAHDLVSSVSCHERIMSPSDVQTNTRRRPMRRGNTNSRINIEERKAFLQGALQLSFY